jgi:MFS family permease
MGLGSILASFWCERHDTIQPKFMTLGDASIGAAALACGLAPHLGVVIAAFLVVGAAVTISMVTSRAIRIRRFPANAQGRLVMINRTALYSLLLPSILLAGWLADHVSSPALFIAYGLVGLGAAALGLALGVPNIDTHAVDNSIDHASDNSTHEAPAQVGDARVVDDPTTSRTIAATLGQSHLPPTNTQAKDP